MNRSNAVDELDQLSMGQKVITMFSPHQIALLIRSLDSQLISIDYKQVGDEAFLLYVFAVAGKAQAFQVALTSESLDSIADLYPAAVAFEAKLQEQWGLVFHPSSDKA